MTILSGRYLPSDKRPLVTFKDRHLRERWPKADSARCHLFEAVGIVGEAMHGDLWTGQELGVVQWDVSPDQEAALARRTANPTPPPSPPPRSIASTDWGAPNRIARGGTAGTSMLATTASAGDAEQGDDLSRRLEAAATVHKLKQAAWEDNAAATKRLTGAVEWLAAECRDGRVRSFVRFRERGALMDMQPHEWNVDHPVTEFLVEGGFERLFPVAASFQKFGVYIFIDRASLASAVAVFGRASAPVPMAELARLSPFLRLAVELALQRNYVEGGNTDPEKVRKAAVRHAWPSAFPGVEPSDAAINAIAKVIGFPDMDALQRGIRANKGRKR